ncbi:hypothetical protein LPJ53_000656 [Coemansia erecta]|uniref:DUF410-domain-containing protein n=1 Tax=Coemansia erecta TaxID=147472 RepID=A0A9W7Y845_9FUNG|nr:hypothetical protein LPJ53_000656 [Coemansia erecta]
MSSNSRIERFLNSLRENLTEGNYYEGHQELRAIASRFVKQKKHDRAIEFLYLGALELCQYNQWGSVADLASFMINIYIDEKVPVTPENKERVFDILEKLSQATEYYPRVYESAIQWTIGEIGRVGDSQMHHFVGCVMRNKGRYKEAEQHFLVGTADSPQILGNMLVEWAVRTDAKDYGMFVARGVLKYLALGWYEAACFCWRGFIARMAAVLPNAVSERSENASLPSKVGPVYYVSSPHELVNFVQLLLLTVERSDGNAASDATRIFDSLRRKYEASFGVNSATVGKLMDLIAEKYFGVVVQHQQSLYDIVNSLFAAPPSLPTITNDVDEDMD